MTNYPIAATLCLICVALIAHMAGGVKESLSVRPRASIDVGVNDFLQVKVVNWPTWLRIIYAFFPGIMVPAGVIERDGWTPLV